MRAFDLPILADMIEPAAVSTPSHGHAPGSQFGKYTILEHIGRGGMGDVYKAVQHGLDRPVALKVLPHLLARSSEFSDRFNAEALAISRLQHQNIVTLYDYGEVDGQKYIAMQFIHGLTLSRLNQREKPLPYHRIISITKQICRGLKYAHANDIVHRDIKSGNIMIEGGDKVYISDFGIAKAVDSPSITTTGMALGTPEFMSPEQCEGGIVDGQSDIYGLGMILFEIIAGKPPFMADSPLAVAYKQVNEQPPLLGKLRPDIPRRLELIVAKCIKKNKLERYQNADELLRDLDTIDLEASSKIEVVHELPTPNLRITDRRESSRRRDKNEKSEPIKPLLSLLFATLLLGIIALQVYQIWNARPAQPPFGPLPIGLITGPTSELKDDIAQGPQALVDGLRSTVWGMKPSTQAAMTFDFGQTVLLSQVIVEGGRMATGQGPALPPPESFRLISEGQAPIRISLRNTLSPQVVSIGMVGRHFELQWESAAGLPSAVREWRAYGLPYE